MSAVFETAFSSKDRSAKKCAGGFFVCILKLIRFCEYGILLI